MFIEDDFLSGSLKRVLRIPWLSINSGASGALALTCDEGYKQYKLAALLGMHFSMRVDIGPFFEWPGA